jgi:hypothetical protein
MPPLHRQTPPPGVTVASYRTELAQDSARFHESPETAARQYADEVVEITSLQSEGYIKRDINDAPQDDCTLEEFQALQAQLQDDYSANLRLLTRSGQLDAEAKAVLQDVASRLHEVSGLDPAGFFFQPVTLGTDILQGRLTMLDEADQLQSVYSVALHDTPGFDNGLLLVTPLQGRELNLSAEQILREARSTPGVYLGDVDSAWQFHKQSFK